MRAYEDPLRSHVAQQSVEDRPVASTHDGVDPDEDAVHRQQPLPDQVGGLIRVDDGLSLNRARGELLENAPPPGALRSWRRGARGEGLR